MDNDILNSERMTGEFKANLDRICGEGWKFNYTQAGAPGYAYDCDGQFTLYDRAGLQAAGFFLVKFPGCCGICISYHTVVGPGFRNKGLANVLHKLKTKLAIRAGYTIMLATDVDSNVHQQKVFAKNGWKHIFSFRNRRSKNLLNITVKDLYPVVEEKVEAA